MKKLMTMLSAVALAFGVQATETWHSGTSFEGLTADENFNLTSGEGLNWQTNGAPTLTIADTTGRTLSFDRAWHWRNESALRALSVKTTFGQPVFRTNSTAVTMGQVFVDTLVKPTICEDGEITLGSDAKIAIWFKEVEDGNTCYTNLMITAGYIQADGTCVRTNYTCGTIANADDWQRFTVKSFADITSTGSGVPGFVVFRNGTAVVCSSPKGSSSAAALNNLSTQAGLYNKYGELFPSAVQGNAAKKTTIEAIGFDGTGLVDEVLFTDNVEEFAAPFKSFNLAWDQYVTGFTYEVKKMGAVVKSDTLSGLAAAGSIVIEVEADVEVEITAISHSGTYVDGALAVSGTGIAADGNTFSITSSAVTDASTGTITSMLPTVFVTVGGLRTPYGSIAEAFAAANAASGAVTMQLAAAQTLSSAVTLNNSGLELTLDLAGNTLTYSGSGYAITAEIPLTITNSTQTVGGISATQVVTSSAELRIYAGTFSGAVNIANGSAWIYGGTFNGTVSASTTQFIYGGTFASEPNSSYLAFGYGYSGTNPWVVDVAVYTITYLDSDRTLLPDTIVPATYSLGDGITPTPNPVKAGFNFTGWTWYAETGGDPVPVTYVPGNIAANLILVANWTPAIVTYTVTVAAPGANVSVEVSTNGVQIGTAGGDYTVVAGSNVSVEYSAAADYKLSGTDTFTFNAISANQSTTAPTATACEYYTSVSLNKATTSIETNLTETLVATFTPASAADDSYTWASSDTSKATVDQNGVVTAIAAGEVTITVTATHDPTVTASCTVTVTATAPTPVEPTIDPASNTPVEVEAESAAAAKEAVKITPPAASGADAATYKALFNLKAEPAGEGKFDVSIDSIKESVKEGVATTAEAIVSGTAASGTVTVPAGLYYKVTTYTALGGTPTVAVPSTLSTGAASSAISKPGDTQGFIKVEIGTAPIK